MQEKYVITKKTKNGLNVFQGNKNYTKKHFTTDINQAWFYWKIEDVENRLNEMQSHLHGDYFVVSLSELRNVLMENVEISMQMFKYKG